MERVKFSCLTDKRKLKEFLNELDEETWRHWYRFGRDAETAYSNILSTDNVLFTVGTLDDKIISLAYLDRFYPNKKHCRFGIVVHPSYRGRKIGTEHVKYILRIARELGVEKICLSVDTRNKAALKLYQKFGWKIVTFFPDNKTRCEMELVLKEVKRNEVA